MALRTTHIATIVVGVAIVVATGIVTVQNLGHGGGSVTADAPVGTASLAVESKTVKVDEQFSVNATINTGSNANNNRTSGADVLLSYDPTVLTVIDADPAVVGVQVTSGKVFDFVQANKVNTKLGQISFSAGQQPTNQPVRASQAIMLTITFKAKTAGRSPLRFSYTAGATDDSNVIQPKTGRDLLNHVVDGIVTVK